jgi:hypothetical protein
MEGVSGTGSNGIMAIDALKKSMKVEEMQASKALESSAVDNTKMQDQKKSSELAAQSTGLGVNINIQG